MSYRMTELTDTVRIGTMGDGTLDIEVWDINYKESGAELLQEVLIPVDAVSELFEYLR